VINLSNIKAWWEFFHLRLPVHGQAPSDWFSRRGWTKLLLFQSKWVVEEDIEWFLQSPKSFTSKYNHWLTMRINFIQRPLFGTRKARSMEDECTAHQRCAQAVIFGLRWEWVWEGVSWWELDGVGCLGLDAWTIDDLSNESPQQTNEWLWLRHASQSLSVSRRRIHYKRFILLKASIYK